MTCSGFQPQTRSVTIYSSGRHKPNVSTYSFQLQSMTVVSWIHSGLVLLWDDSAQKNTGWQCLQPVSDTVVSVSHNCFQTGFLIKILCHYMLLWYKLKADNTYLILLRNEGRHGGVAPTIYIPTGSTQFAQQAANQTHTNTNTCKHFVCQCFDIRLTHKALHRTEHVYGKSVSQITLKLSMQLADTCTSNNLCLKQNSSGSKQLFSEQLSWTLAWWVTLALHTLCTKLTGKDMRRAWRELISCLQVHCCIIHDCRRLAKIFSATVNNLALLAMRHCVQKHRLFHKHHRI